MRLDDGAGSRMSAARRFLALGVALSTMVVGLAVPTVAQAATSPPTAAVVPAADPVPGQYIVTLEGGTAPAEVPGEAEQLADRYDAGVLDVYDTALVGFSARMSADDAQRLAADPRVALVEQDGYVQASVTQPTPGGLWGLDRIDQRDLPVNGSYTYTTAAANVHAYVLDTGLFLSHSDFAGRVDPGIDFVDGGTPADCSGHGTHVTGTLAGTTYGVAKGVRIVPVRVLDCGGQGTFSNVIAGVNWVTQNAIRPAVANMSLGGTRSQTLDNAIGTSINSGVTYTVAAGNNREDACLSSPGDRRAIVVGASTQTDARADFSNWGSCVDLFAPGDRILSDSIGGGTATASGTSMAAPHVAGAAALYLAGHPLASVDEVTTALACTATIGHVTDTMGSLNVLLDTQDLTATAPLLPCTPVLEPPASGIGTVHLSWNTAIGAVPIEQFRIDRGTASGALAPYRTLPGTMSSYDDLTGAAGTWYYRITALGGARGDSAPSAEVVGTATAPALTATALPLAAHLEWTVGPDAGPAISRFDVVQGSSPGTGTLIASLPPTQTTFDVQLPGPLTAALLRRACGQAGAVGHVRPHAVERGRGHSACGRPTRRAGAVRVGREQAGEPELDGAAVEQRHGAIANYKILRGSTAGGEVPLTTVPGSQTSYSDSPLANGTAYYYKVVANTAAFGDGSASNEQVVVPSGVEVAFLTPSTSVELRRVDGDVRRVPRWGSAARAPRIPRWCRTPTARSSSSAAATTASTGTGSSTGFPRAGTRSRERSRRTRSRSPTARTSRSSSAAETTGVPTDDGGRHPAGLVGPRRRRHVEHRGGGERYDDTRLRARRRQRAVRAADREQRAAGLEFARWARHVRPRRRDRRVFRRHRLRPRPRQRALPSARELLRDTRRVGHPRWERHVQPVGGLRRRRRARGGARRRQRGLVATTGVAHQRTGMVLVGRERQRRPGPRRGQRARVGGRPQRRQQPLLAADPTPGERLAGVGRAVEHQARRRVRALEASGWPSCAAPGPRGR